MSEITPEELEKITAEYVLVIDEAMITKLIVADDDNTTIKVMYSRIMDVLTKIGVKNIEQRGFDIYAHMNQEHFNQVLQDLEKEFNFDADALGEISAEGNEYLMTRFIWDACTSSENFADEVNFSLRLFPKTDGKEVKNDGENP